MEKEKLSGEIFNYCISRPKRPVILSSLTKPSNNLDAHCFFVKDEENFLKEYIIPHTTIYKSWIIKNSEQLIHLINVLQYEPKLDEIEKIDFTQPFHCVIAWLPYRD